MSGDERRPAPRGILAEALSLFGSVGRYAQALSALAAEEGREAGFRYLRVAVLLLGGLVCLLLGYILLLLFLAFWLNAAFGLPWLWITLGLAVAHGLITALCAFGVRRGIREPVFPETARVLRSDFESLRGTPKP